MIWALSPQLKQALNSNMVKEFGFSLGLYPNEVLSSNQAQYRTRRAAHWIHSYLKVAQQQSDKNKPDKNERKNTQKLKLSLH